MECCTFTDRWLLDVLQATVRAHTAHAAADESPALFVLGSGLQIVAEMFTSDPAAAARAVKQ
eukprot:6058544-Karenia_brevis.AAC.1